MLGEQSNIYVVEGFHLTPKYRILCYLCTDYIGHRGGAHETLEMLDGMLDSSDHPEQSSTEHGKAKASNVRCSVNSVGFV